MLHHQIKNCFRPIYTSLFAAKSHSMIQINNNNIRYHKVYPYPLARVSLSPPNCMRPRPRSVVSSPSPHAKTFGYSLHSHFSLCALSICLFPIFYMGLFLPEITLMMMVIQLSEIGPPKMQDWKWRTKPINGWKSMRQLQAYRKIDDQVIGGKRMFSMLHFQPYNNWSCIYRWSIVRSSIFLSFIFSAPSL